MALLALWGIGAGAITSLLALPPTDIDGPVPWTNRVFWSAVGIGIALTGLVVLAFAVRQIIRAVPSRTASVR